MVPHECKPDTGTPTTVARAQAGFIENTGCRRVHMGDVRARQAAPYERACWLCRSRGRGIVLGVLFFVTMALTGRLMAIESPKGFFEPGITGLISRSPPKRNSQEFRPTR